MRIVKCALTPWTMCVHEGLYWDDSCMDELVEDQPFPLSFVPTDRRVFGKDDCEGRASQAQEMVELFVNIYRYMLAHPAAKTLQMLQKSGMCSEKLQVQPETLAALLQGCCKIGRMLDVGGVLQAQTVVGDANAEAITNPAVAAGDSMPTQTPISHSFGILTYDDGHQSEYMMIENTGWQRRVLPGDRKFTDAEIEFMKAWVRHLKAIQCDTTAIMAGSVVKRTENHIYNRLYMGPDKIFFTQNTRGELAYGVTLAAINEGGGLHHYKKKMNAAVACDIAVYMSMEEFLMELSATHQSQPPIWQAREDAENMLAKYKRLQATIPELRRTLMTPQKTESEFEALMRDWEPICDHHSYPRHGSQGIWFTVDRNTWHSDKQEEGYIQQAIRNSSPMIVLEEHPFMRSIVVCARQAF